MNNYITIQNNETIGDSLSSVNLNYINLEKDTISISNVANTQWKFLYDYYKTFSEYIKSSTTFCQNNSSIFLNSATTVENNSSTWIKPITIFYPSIFPTTSSNYQIQNVILNWVESTFPVVSANPILVTNLKTGVVKYGNNLTPAYVEGQRLIVYSYTWFTTPKITSINQLQDYTQCYTESTRVFLECSTAWYGGTYCGYDTWCDCGGQKSSCNQDVTLICTYNSPPYENFQHQNFNYVKINGKTTKVLSTTLPGSDTSNPNVINYADSYIRASIKTTHVDRYEDSIKALVFKVENCNWVYERSLI